LDESVLDRRGVVDERVKHRGPRVGTTCGAERHKLLVQPWGSSVVDELEGSRGAANLPLILLGIVGGVHFIQIHPQLKNFEVEQFKIDQVASMLLKPSRHYFKQTPAAAQPPFPESKSQVFQESRPCSWRHDAWSFKSQVLDTWPITDASLCRFVGALACWPSTYQQTWRSCHITIRVSKNQILNQ